MSMPIDKTLATEAAEAILTEINRQVQYQPHASVLHDLTKSFALVMEHTHAKSDRAPKVY